MFLDDGVNVLYILFEVLKFIGVENELVNFVIKYLIFDNLGKKLGVVYKDKEMGNLIVNFGLVSFDNN